MICVAGFEFRHAWFQSNWISEYASQLRYQPVEGQSDAIHFPESGPFDQRLGYSLIPQFQPRLQREGFQITRQMRFSPELMEYAGRGLYVPYDEKTRRPANH